MKILIDITCSSSLDLGSEKAAALFMAEEESLAYFG